MMIDAPKEYRDLGSYLALGPTELANSVLHCPLCGKDHSVPIGRIELGRGLAAELPEIASEILGHAARKTAIIYDAAIEDLVRELVIERAAALVPVPVALGAPGLHLETSEGVASAAAASLDADVELVVGVGSGVIADLTKWIATKARLPFMLYATAASMNAHASITAAASRGGVKESVLLEPAAAVLFDLDAIETAPRPMRLAGLGDLMARSSCNADWKLGHLMLGASFCPVPYELTASGEAACLTAAQGIGAGEDAALLVLSRATIVSAISMTMMGGETSASSGCEHVLSHFWDLQAELEGAPKNLHGIQVGIGTLISHALWHRLRGIDPRSIDPERLAALRPSRELLRAENRARFGAAAGIFDAALESKRIPEAEFVRRITLLLSGWDEMWAELSPFIGDRLAIRRALEKAGFELSLAAIHRTRRQALEALSFGARFRSRYTILDLAGELGILPASAEEILEEAEID